MADPRQNYLQQLRAYAQPQPVSTPMDIPASVRTYSVFDPNSNTWRRMTNDGRSPMPASPAQQQASIADALAQARQTQGTVYPAQGMGQGQPVEMHPGYLNPPAQTPVRGSRTPSPASGGSAGTSLSPAPEASQRASQRGFKASGQDGLLSLGLPSAKASPAPASTPIPAPASAVPVVPIAQGASTVVVPSKAPLTMADQHRRAAVLLGTLPNPDPTPIPSIWSGLGRFLGNGLARFTLDD